MGWKHGRILHNSRRAHDREVIRVFYPTLWVRGEREGEGVETESVGLQ